MNHAVELGKSTGSLNGSRVSYVFNPSRKHVNDKAHSDKVGRSPRVRLAVSIV